MDVPVSKNLSLFVQVYVQVNNDVSQEAEGGDKTSTPTQKEGLDIFRGLERGTIFYCFYIAVKCHEFHYQ